MTGSDSNTLAETGSPAIDNNAKEHIDGEHTAPQTPPKDFKFWLIIVGLLISTFLSALDLTAISTALPTISAALHSTDYTWIGNSYSIGSAAFIPWSAGLAHVFGRRPALLAGLVLFLIGSAMCGAAKTMDLMLVGRTFQGVGSGFILTLTEVVLADLVSLSERGAYQGAFGAIWALASATGPPIGGSLAGANWRWLFYLNLPLSGLIIAVVFMFMDLKTPQGTIQEKIKKMDWTGNAVFIPSITLFIMGLVWGGQQYAWQDAHVLAPLIIGFFGLVLWFFLEKYWVEYPTVPFDVILNTTSLIGYFTTFLHGISALAIFYYLPSWYQAVKGASPVGSAVDFFSVAFIVAPFAMVAGGTISATQVYKPQNIVAWVLMTAGPGLMMIINADSPKKVWASLPVPFSIGIGLLYAATTFPVLAPLSPDLAGHALGFLVFARSIGNIFGITVGSTALANELAKRLPKEFIAQVPGGVSGAYSAIPIIKTLPEPLRTEVRVAFSKSIRVIWLVLIPIGFVGLVTSLFMKQLQLNTATDENWGVNDRSAPADEEAVTKTVAA
ncbi:iron permease [Meredithblackwellia eburnea MCA 4105]